MYVNSIRSLRSTSVPLAAALAIGLVACGDDASPPAAGDSTIPGTTTPDSTTPDTTTPDTTTPDTTAPDTGTIEHPVGADEIVLRIAYEGGFVPQEVAFLNLPTLLVTGDGRLIVQGPMIEIYPGPLLPNLQVRTISEAGIQQLLDLAAEHGLLTERDYTDPTNIADAPDTVVEISANGETYRHQAYALGLSGDGTESDELRQALADFVAEATGDWLYGENPELGPERAYTSDSYMIRALEVGDYEGDIEPTVVDWPADASVRLADATECAEVPAAEVDSLFADATQLTFFAEDGITYQIAAKPQLPGDAC
jgi:hypothetical protein